MSVLDIRIDFLGTLRAEVLSHIRGLANVRRYSNQHCAAPESVLQHVGFCCMYAVYLTARLRAAGFEVDGERLLTAAALHDAEESETGDIVRTAKHFSAETKKAFAELGFHAAQRVLPAFGIAALDLWMRAKEAETLEGLSMQLIDLASVGEFIENELLHGNRSFEKLLDQFEAYVNSYLSLEGVLDNEVLKGEAETILERTLRMKKAREERK